MRLVELEKPEPGPGEVLLRVAACGVCGSDLTTYKMGLGTGVLGHEIGAVVEAAGPGVDGLRVGDHVAVDPKLPCGRCPDCLAGRENRCVDTLTKNPVRPGGYAEWLAAPHHIVRRLPDGLEPEMGALAEPLSVAVHAVGRSGIGRGDPAMVVGLGSIGLLAVIALRAAGAGPITAVEPDPERRALGLELGVAEAVETGGDARTHLDRVPVVVECSGKAEAVQVAIDMADSGGRVVMAGIAVADVPFFPVFLITREIELAGSICATRSEFEHSVSLLPRYPELRSLFGRRLRLEEVPDAFASLAAGERLGGGKPVVLPGL